MIVIPSSRTNDGRTNYGRTNDGRTNDSAPRRTNCKAKRCVQVIRKFPLSLDDFL